MIVEPGPTHIPKEMRCGRTIRRHGHPGRRGLADVADTGFETGFVRMAGLALCSPARNPPDFTARHGVTGLKTVDLIGSTCASVALHATRDPASVAIVHRGVAVTYRLLASQILSVMDELTDAGLDCVRTLGVEAPDRYLHLLIVLAAEALGITTISLQPSELPPSASLGLLCDRMLVSHPPADPVKAFMMTPDWVSRVFRRAEDGGPRERLQRPVSPDAVLRLMKSSGTTGVPKVMGMTHALLQRQIDKLLRHVAVPITAHPDFLCLYNFSPRATYTRCALTLQRGGTIRFSGADVLWENIVAGIGNYVLFTSGDLERFIRAIPYGRGPFNIHIDVMGGSVSPRLRQETRDKITGDFQVNYSSNETHHISRVGDDEVGTLYDDVQVRIVDDRGKRVPLGQSGSIQVKTGTMIDGYVGDAALDQAAFIDGWYHTNDFGYQPSRRTLIVIGRSDDMLNLGGVKIAPGPIEADLRTIDGVSDALVTALDDQLVTSVMLVAIELQPGADRARVATLIRELLRGHVAYAELLLLSELPRTDTGKIQRATVKDLYRQQALAL
jgi:acyl-CoA synthetase (AMP-forming)/AMP-acid ligase II